VRATLVSTQPRGPIRSLHELRAREGILSAQPQLPSSVPPASPGPLVRVEYVDFQNLAEHREYRFRSFGAGGWTEFRVRIASEAFEARRVRLQDGPDVCYRKLLQLVAAAETPGPGAITIDDADIASYLEARAPAPKRRRSFSAASPWVAPVVPPRPQVTRSPRLRVEPPPVPSDIEPALQEGQRVSHSLYGAGVTGATGGGHTVVRFDQEDGPKTFVTSLLEVDVLSAPQTWESGPRGNRPCAELLASPQALPPAEILPT